MHGDQKGNEKSDWLEGGREGVSPTSVCWICKSKISNSLPNRTNKYPEHMIAMPVPVRTPGSAPGSADYAIYAQQFRGSVVSAEQLFTSLGTRRSF